MSSETIVLITGANTGLGFATVKALAASSKAQYKILLGGRSIDKARAAAEEARPLLVESSIEPVQIDIEDDDSIEALVETIKQKYGRIDVLVNNAGTSTSRCPSCPH
jgi:NAD(P)-dependent dehydrogenase (short-subunit alcohol dehydrogenase family)